VREALRKRLHLPEPVVGLEGVEELADGHLLVAGCQEHFVTLPLGRQLVEPALVDLLGRFQVRGAAGLDVFDPVARERTVCCAMVAPSSDIVTTRRLWRYFAGS
jgi:hypothetical protein